MKKNVTDYGNNHKTFADAYIFRTSLAKLDMESFIVGSSVICQF